MLILATGFVLFLVLFEARAEVPRVVASIPPVHSLVAGVMKGLGAPRLLLGKGASPHGYALKPSDARALGRADLVVWIGPELESFLAKPFEVLAPRAQKLPLLRAAGLRTMAARKGGVWKAAADPEHDDHDDHGGTGIDPHIWLDPANAIVMLHAIAAALVRLDAVNAARYRTNAQGMVRTIKALDRAIAERLRVVRGVPYLVFHDAYGYFERRYRLNAVGAVVVAADRRPGVRRIRQIRNKLRRAKAACVFAEPQFSSKILNTLVEGTTVRISVLDPVGTELAPGPGQYAALLTGLADGLVDCLGGKTKRR